MPYPSIKEIFEFLDTRLNGFAKLLLTLVGFIALIMLFNSSGVMVSKHILGIDKSKKTFDYTYITVSKTADMELVLKKHGLWDIDENSQIEPVVFNRYPGVKADRDLSEKKKIFFHVILPAALIAQAKVEEERKTVINALSLIGKDPELINFDPDETVWKKKVPRPVRKKLYAITKKYQSMNAAELLNKVDTIPVSLLLAQSAIESAWGSSRFAVKGNNMFGIWTWGENGMVPESRDANKSHRVAVFVSILDSVKAYTLMLNRLPAYKKFRSIREKSRDSLKLADGLINYSSRRSLYVKDVKRMIKMNNLKRFDTNTLSKKSNSNGMI